MQLRGAMTALITPFRDGKVDEARLREQTQRQIDAGIKALVPCGTTGESPTLNYTEHDRVIELVIEAAADRVPVIAGTGSNSTDEALMLTRHAQKAGAAASLQVSPYYNKPSQEGLYRHFVTIADACDLPMVLYNIPGRTGVALSIDTIQRLAAHPNIIAIKEATGSLDMASEIAATTDLIILSGDDSLTLPIISVGGKGVISVASNLVPQRVVSLVDAALEGRFDDARQQHLNLFPLFKALFLDGNPTSVKAAMRLTGLDTGDLRLPLVPMHPTLEKALRHVLETQAVLDTAPARP